MGREDYAEHEIKILDIAVDSVVRRLEETGARKVFDGERMITVFDTENGQLRKDDKLVRITEEGTTKVSMHVRNSEPKHKEIIKFKASRQKEVQDFFAELGLFPVAQVRARRISFELNGVDFDIDKFPAIPAFMEIDTKELSEDNLAVIVDKLGLSDNRRVDLGTEVIHGLYDIDYFDAYKMKIV